MLRTYSIIIARAEIGEFVEYDLDNEDEDWLQEYNRDRKTLEAEKYILLVFAFIFRQCVYIYLYRPVFYYINILISGIMLFRIVVFHAHNFAV